MSIGLKLAVATAGGRLGSTPQAFMFPVPGFELDESDLAQTATFTTDAVDLGHGGILDVTMTLANVGGTTPSLTTTVQTSRDGTTWVPAMIVDTQTSSYAAAILGNLPAQTANGNVNRTFAVKRYVRMVHTISGTTPTFDIAVVGFIRAE